MVGCGVDASLTLADATVCVCWCGDGTVNTNFVTTLPRSSILAVKALTRRFMSVSEPDNSLDVLIVTPGGTASTAMIEHISKFLPVNNINDSDGLKHQPFPPRWLSKNPQTKVIFIDRDVSKIIASLERRGYVKEQLAKLGSFGGCFAGTQSAKNMLKAAIDRQRQNWHNHPSANILFIEYETLWDKIETMRKFLGITDERFVNFFPRNEKRGIILEATAKAHGRPLAQLEEVFANLSQWDSKPIRDLRALKERAWWGTPQAAIEQPVTN